ncbi:endolytic transglycosylase MltG [Litoreibacter arenae]|uniref:Endolytic murein transglycosylase n=1 Tax=Litoreibacter arenae DSM 19593 TaxID=1123360 RepID=S9S1V0_9RHOB|nr:endolytic transglycosylase MltG [Litoreibacter arenae]EPX80184.1 putative YceG protein [Litoreibacter arenae DSM 19593]
MWKSIASNFLTLFILLLVAAGALVGWGQAQYTKTGPLEDAICVRVPLGGSMALVSRDLEAKGAVSNGRIFRIGADYADKSQQLKAGSFLVPAGASMEQIVDIVTRGGQNTCGTEVVYRIGVTSRSAVVRELDPTTNEYIETAKFTPGVDEAPQVYVEARDDRDVRYRVAVAEGATSWQIVDSLRALDVFEGEIDETPPEGSLAPDSYEVQPGADRAALIAKMTAAQEKILAEAWEARDPNVPLESPEEALILASIIEKETGVPEERRQVASVFTNRLRQGIKLQTDPTVIYGVTRGEGVLGRGLRQSELRRETPYNTYVIPGLPPTPIANPGKLSIEAALNPDDTPYIFFVADGTGGHAFAVTIEDHNRNVAEWRKIEAERAAQN